MLQIQDLEVIVIILNLSLFYFNLHKSEYVTYRAIVQE